MYSLETLSEFDFEISSHCNSKCPQCPRYDQLGRVQKDLNVTHLDVNLIRQLPIDQMPNLQHVTLCGNFGDPLMHPQLNDIIDIFSKQKILISTNASLRSTDWWTNLGKNKNVSVMFCIDGIGEVHEYYRRNTSYEKIMNNARAFIDAGGTALWQYIVFKHNEHQIEEVKKISEEMGFKNVEFIYSDRFDTANKWPVYEDGNYLYDLEKSSTQTTLREELGSKTNDKYWKELYKGKGEISCVWSKNKKLYIHSDGCVYPCCMLGSIQTGKNIEKLMLKKLIKNFDDINLHKHDLGVILNSDIYNDILPKSFDGHPFQHPVCVEWCNKNTGKIALKGLKQVNTDRQIS